MIYLRYGITLPNFCFEFGLLLFVFSVVSGGKQCIQSKIGTACQADEECFELGENHLYCNITHNANVCAFYHDTYIGEVDLDLDCPGPEFSAEPWSNPVDLDLMDGSDGNDCMRMCLLTETCFGITINDYMCYLRNDACFNNLQPVEGAIVGVLNFVREDYHCGTRYPLYRNLSTGDVVSWPTTCPETQTTLTNNPYRCCSERGLCIQCSSENTATENYNEEVTLNH